MAGEFSGGVGWQFNALPASVRRTGICEIAVYLHPHFDELAAKVDLAKKRIYVAGCGVEDWDAVPLRLPLVEETGAASPRIFPPGERSEKSEIDHCLARPHCHRIKLQGDAGASRPSSPEDGGAPAQILFLPLEIADWKQAKHLAYPAQWGWKKV
jgi:hypothetical protein